MAIISNGSRGDVQPLVALALKLRTFRHTVRILTNADAVAFCVERGIDAVPVFASCRAVIETIGGMGGCPTADNPTLPCLTRGKGAAEAWLRSHPDACVAADDALEEFEPDAVVCGSQATGPAMRYELRMGAPAIYAFLSRLHFQYAEALTRLAPARPSFVAMSPLFDEVRVEDYSDTLQQTGDWVLEEAPSEAELQPGGALSQLHRFLAAGPPPVAIGWGSMIAEGMPPIQMLGLALRALRLLGRRGVILGGWARLDELGARLLAGDLQGLGADAKELASFAAARVCFAPAAPHAWLLPKCSCVVHHGGAGTTQAALRAGVPSVVTPIFGDQFANALEVQNLGFGVGFDADEALPKLSPERLSAAIRGAAALAPATSAAGARLRREDGARRAAAAVDAFLRARVQTGRWAQELRAHRRALAAEHASSSSRRPEPKGAAL